MPETITIEDIRKGVRSIVSEVSEIPEADISDEAKFVEDLHIDSMMALEIVAKIEKTFKIAIPEEEIPNVRSLVNIFTLMEKLLKKQ